MNEDFNIVLNKIEAFKRKFFLYKLVRGFLSFSIVFIVFYSIFILMEYQFYLSSSVRKILFQTSMLFFLFFSINSILIPLFKMIGWIKINNKIKISNIITQYFPEIKDRLINVIELNNLNENEYSLPIINAAISQKSRELKIFDFGGAIHLKNLKKLIYYFLLSFSLVTSFYLINSSVVIESGKRIINYNNQYTKPAPFTFELLNKELKVKKGDPFKINVTCTGKNLPSVVYLNIEGNNYLMKQKDNNIFEYEMSSVINNIRFYFTDLKYKSNTHYLGIVKVPVINQYTIDITPPLYTKINANKITNIGDIKIPIGSEIIWNFFCYDTDSLIVKCKSGLILLAERISNNIFKTHHVFNKPDIYEILVKNKETVYESTMKSIIEIIEDMYPEIVVTQIQDSTFLTRFFFNGTIKDDYGFSKLNFHLKGEEIDTIIDIPFVKGLNHQDFYFAVNFNSFFSEKNSLNYYFSITDNDMVNGPKTTLSESYMFSFPSQEEINEKNKEDFKTLENLIKESKIVTKEIQSEIKELQLKSLNSISSWDKNQMVNDIISKKNNLENILDKIGQINKSGNNYQNTFDQQSESMAEKQKQIEELLDDIMTEELKKLLDEFNKLAEDFNNRKFNDVNQKLEFSLEDLSKQLDRNLEMLKRMKVEKRIENLIKMVDKVKSNEEKESEDILESKDFTGTENQINEDITGMNAIKEEIDSIQIDNNELKKPLIFDSFEKEQQEIQESLINTKKALLKKNKKDSSESMKETAQKLEYLSFALKKMMEANESENKGENILTIKRILKNLLYISVNQEEVLKKLSVISDNDPVLRNLKKQQMIFSEQFQVIKDSLYALQNRSPQIGNYVNDEIVSINLNLLESVNKLEENNISQATISQRMVITAANNMVLFLSDLIQKMEMQPENGEESDENCNNGTTGKKMGSLKKSAGDLKEQLQNIIEKMKNGQGKNLSKELSESLMQHEMMQKMLRELINNGGLGNEGRKQLQQIDQLLDQNRKEIANKAINKNLLERNNEIMSKLLEAEKSEMERELENKRESNTADEKFYSNPAKYFINRDIKNTTLENWQRNNIKLTNFYLEKQRIYLEKSNINDSE